LRAVYGKQAQVVNMVCSFYEIAKTRESKNTARECTVFSAENKTAGLRPHV